VSGADVVQVVVPVLSALTGLAVALTSLTDAWAQLRRIAAEAARTGVQPAAGAMQAALTEEVHRVRGSGPGTQR
jgi:hypothetical protein